MPSRIPYHSVVVHRDGKNIRVPVGKPFDFSPEEIRHFDDNNGRSLRRPIREDVVVDEPVFDTVDDPEVTSAANRQTPPPRRPATPAKRAATTVADDDEL